MQQLRSDRTACEPADGRFTEHTRDHCAVLLRVGSIKGRSLTIAKSLFATCRASR